MSEYTKLKARKFQDYSVGHRRMYEGPCKVLAGSRSSVLEVGFGIGWGLSLMRREGVFSSYLGLEPDPASFHYTQKATRGWEGVRLLNQPFPCDVEGVFDHVFCIEVVEHLPPEARYGFIRGLRAATKKMLWLSTPCSLRSNHGVLLAAQWQEMLEGVASFKVLRVEEQWTTLFMCQPV